MGCWRVRPRVRAGARQQARRYGAAVVVNNKAVACVRGRIAGLQDGSVGKGGRQAASVWAGRMGVETRA